MEKGGIGREARERRGGKGGEGEKGPTSKGRASPPLRTGGGMGGRREGSGSEN